MQAVVMEMLLTLAKVVATTVKMLAAAAGFDFLPLAAVAALVILLTAKAIQKNRSKFSCFSRAESAAANPAALGQPIETQRILTQKQCPNCDARLPLSALLCDACDYNFLAARPGRGLKALPAPEPVTPKASVQRIATANR